MKCGSSHRRRKYWTTRLREREARGSSEIRAAKSTQSLLRPGSPKHHWPLFPSIQEARGRNGWRGLRVHLPQWAPNASRNCQTTILDTWKSCNTVWSLYQNYYYYFFFLKLSHRCSLTRTYLMRECLRWCPLGQNKRGKVGGSPPPWGAVW